MKKNIFAATAMALAVFALSITSCSDKKEAATAETGEAAEQPATVKVESESFEPTTNIRYYNMDSVMANYELVKKFNEANLRTMTELQNAQRSRESELNRLASSIQQKVQNNGYLSEASYNADMEELNKKQQSAQNYLGSLQQKAQEESLRQQNEFLDSLDNFLAEYNKTRHYDAILLYAPGEHFNPALDITQEIITGLNAKYKK